MDSKFIPFAPLSAHSASGPTGIKSNKQNSDWSPLSIQPKSPTTASATVPGCADASSPTVSLKREGERVTQIRIQCTCGRVIELDCLYSDSPN